MNPAWWSALGPAETKLRCGDAEHRLRWADGTLQAADHPDAEGELVLAALGGDSSPCLDMVATWGKHSDDLAVLAVGPRSATDRLTFPASVLDEIAAASGAGYHGLGNPQAQAGSVGGTIAWHGAAASSGVVIYAGQSGRPPRRVPPLVAARARASRRARMLRGHATYGRSFGWRGFAAPGRHVAWRGGWEVDEGRAELIRLLALGPPFQFRLSAAVAHAWSSGGEQADRARPALTAALTGRLALAAGHWLSMDPGEVEASIHDGDGWGELALTKASGTGRLQARLPVGWLASVWAPGFAVVDGHLVVSVLDATWPAVQVLALRAPGSDPVELGIRRTRSAPGNSRRATRLPGLRQDNGHWSVTSR